MSDIPFVREFDFSYGQHQPVSGRVSRIVCQNPGPFTYTGTNVFIIGAGHEVAIIDPGPILQPHLDAITRTLSGKSLTHIFVTHHHSDHSPLAQILSKTHKCPIYGLNVDHTANSSTDIQLDAGNDPNFKVDVEVKDGEMFCGPDWTIEAIHTPGHCSNHVCYNLVEENTLFSGDHIMGWATSVVISPDGNMAQYMASLDKTQSRNFAKIFPTHGPEILDTKPFLGAYIAHRKQREEQIYQAVLAGHAKIMDMVSHIYSDVDKRLYPAAALSVFAHLIHLNTLGRIQCRGTPRLDGEYKATPR